LQQLHPKFISNKQNSL